MISYAGQPLIHPTPELQAWCALNVNPGDLQRFAGRSWPGPGLERLTGPPDWPSDRAVLARLTWPTGAARFATFYGLVDGTGLEQIRSQVYASGGYQPADLTFSDGLRSLTVSLWMLPAWPLQQISGAGDLYLLTLVDDRYHWWFRPAGLTIDGGITTWSALYLQIAAALNVSFSLDTVDPVYLKPSTHLAAQYRSLPLVLDAVAASCGQRVVRQLNGVVSVQNADAARQSLLEQLDSLSTKQAGGVLTLSDGASDNRALLPASVTVVFADDAGEPGQVATVTLASLALADLGTQSFPGSKRLHSTARSTASNVAELTALAQAAARDWYRWQLGPCDLVLIGVGSSDGTVLSTGGTSAATWTLTGLEDGLQVSQEAGSLATRIYRGPYHDQVENLFHHGTAGTATLTTPGPFNVGPSNPVTLGPGGHITTLTPGRLPIMGPDGQLTDLVAGDRGPVSWTDYQSRCQSFDGTDTMVRYKRNVTAWIALGRLFRNSTPWEFDKKIATGVSCEADSELETPTSCCPGLTVLADSLPITFHDGVGCALLENPVDNLTHNPEQDRWETSFTFPGGVETRVRLYCLEADPSYFALELEGDCSTGGALAADAGATCDPACLVWTDLPISGCCDGTIGVTIGNCPTTPATCLGAGEDALLLSLLADGGLGCECLVVTDYPMPFVGGTPIKWETDTFVPECNTSNQYALTCDGDSWDLTSVTATCYDGAPWTLVFSREDPFELQFELVTTTNADVGNCGTCAEGTAVTLSVIITKAP